MRRQSVAERRARVCPLPPHRLRQVRNARQQDFIRWTKEGYSTGQLLGDESKLLRIFGKHVQSDHSLHTTDGLIELFDLIVDAQRLTVKSIPFPEYFGNCTNGGQTPCYVYADGSGPSGTLPVGTATPAEANAYRRFMTPTVAHHSTSTTITPPVVTTPAHSTKTGKGTAHHPSRRHRSQLDLAGLIADTGDGKSQAAQLGKVGMPVYYPKEIVAGPYAGYCFSITGNCDDGQEPAGRVRRLLSAQVPDPRPHRRARTLPT